MYVNTADTNGKRDVRREYEDIIGWSGVVAIALGFLISVVDRSALLGWISALSGWAALGAAAPTVYYLNRQIRDTQQQHNEMVLLQVMGKISLCRRVIENATRASGIAFFMIENMRSGLDRQRDYEQTALFRLNGLRIMLDLLRNPIMAEFESEIGSDLPGRLHDTIAALVANCETLEGEIESPENLARQETFISHAFAEVMTDVQRYSAAVDSGARAFIDRWDKLH